MVRVVALAAFAAGMAASQTVDGPELLGRIREHVRAGIVEVPNYTCLETMDRTSAAPNGHVEFRERLRVEVLVAGHKELFAWPGSTDFRDPVEDWIGAGAIGTGSFWTQLHNLFVASSASVKYAGVETVGRRTLYRFDFRMPLLSGQMTLTIQGRSAGTGYSGSFWIDKDTLDLVRLETRAEGIPPDIDCREDRTSTTYSRIGPGDGDRFLPSASDLEIINRDGHVSHNAVTFSGCRHYGAVSSVSFDDKPAASSAPVAAQREMRLPGDVTLVLKLSEPVTAESSAAGDPVVAVLDKSVRAGEIRLPKGTQVLGRIRRLERHSQSRQESTEVAMEFFAAEAPEGRIHFKVRLTGPESTPGTVKNTLAGAEFVSGTDGLEIMDDGAGSGVGRFRVSGKNVRLERGFLTIWKTE